MCLKMSLLIIIESVYKYDPKKIFFSQNLSWILNGITTLLDVASIFLPLNELILGRFF